MDRLRWLLLVSVAGLLIAHPKVAFASSVSESDTLIVFGKVSNLLESAPEGSTFLEGPAGLELPKIAVLLAEPNGSISDVVFSVTLSERTFFVLLSDPLRFNTNGFIVKKIREKPGEVQDLSKQFGLPIFKVKVLSDKDVVPEPSSLLLLGSGLLGFVPALRRKKLS